MLRSVLLIACTLASLASLPLCVPASARAQSRPSAQSTDNDQRGVSWGIRGAVGVSSFGGDTGALVDAYETALGSTSSEIALMPKYSAGAVLFVPLTSWARAEPMVSVEETGVALQATRPAFGFFATEDAFRAEISAIYARLTLPLVLHAAIGDTWTLRASGGPVLRRRIAGDHRVSFPVASRPTRTVALEPADWDAGLTVGVGTESPFHDGTLILDIGVDIGLTDAATLHWTPATLAPRHQALHIGIGYRFGQ